MPELTKAEEVAQYLKRKNIVICIWCKREYHRTSPVLPLHKPLQFCPECILALLTEPDYIKGESKNESDLDKRWRGGLD